MALGQSQSWRNTMCKDREILFFQSGNDRSLDANSCPVIIQQTEGRCRETKLLRNIMGVVSELADGSLNFKVSVWTSADDYRGFYYDIDRRTCRPSARFNKERNSSNIGIATPLVLNFEGYTSVRVFNI